MVLMTRVCHPYPAMATLCTVAWWHSVTSAPRLSPKLGLRGLIVQSTLGQTTMSDNPVATATYATVKVCELPIFLLFSLSYCHQHLHKVAPAFSPYVPVGFLSYFAFVLLTATFGIAFYFTTYVKFILPPRAILTRHVYSLPKSTIPTREAVVAIVASTLGSFGVVALFCSVGVYV